MGLLSLSSLYGLAFAAAICIAGVGAANAEDVATRSGQTGPGGQRPARIEVAFVLDTTGSMGGLIEGAKHKIWSIADGIRRANPNADIRIGLVAYRDRGDLYVTKMTDLTDDIHAVYGELLQFQATGGGDWPESVNEALNVGVTRMAWTHGADTRRIVFLVGDAPPHMDYVQDIPYTDTLKIAERDGIVVNAIQCGDARDTQLVWRSIAQLGRGRYIPIPQEGGVVTIETPYDKEILDLQIRITRTVVPYGPERQQREVKGKARVNIMAPAPSSADIASFNSRAPKATERRVITGDGDLTADVLAGRVKVQDVPAAQLAPELQGLSEEARTGVIERQVAERQKLQGDLDALIAKRDKHLAENRPARQTDGFDEAVDRLIGEETR